MTSLLEFTAVNHNSKVISKLQRQYSEGRNCDLEIRLKEKQLYAHKCLVDVFMIEAATEMENNRFFLDLTLYSESAITALLQMIYTGKLCMYPEQIAEVYRAAIQLGFRDVVKICLKHWEATESPEIAPEPVDDEPTVIVKTEPVDGDYDSSSQQQFTEQFSQEFTASDNYGLSDQTAIDHNDYSLKSQKLVDRFPDIPEWKPGEAKNLRVSQFTKTLHKLANTSIPMLSQPTSKIVYKILNPDDLRSNSLIEKPLLSVSGRSSKDKMGKRKNFPQNGEDQRDNYKQTTIRVPVVKVIAKRKIYDEQSEATKLISKQQSLLQKTLINKNDIKNLKLKLLDSSKQYAKSKNIAELDEKNSDLSKEHMKEKMTIDEKDKTENINQHKSCSISCDFYTDDFGAEQSEDENSEDENCQQTQFECEKNKKSSEEEPFEHFFSRRRNLSFHEKGQSKDLISRQEQFDFHEEPPVEVKSEVLDEESDYLTTGNITSNAAAGSSSSEEASQCSQMLRLGLKRKRDEPGKTDDGDSVCKWHLRTRTKVNYNSLGDGEAGKWSDSDTKVVKVLPRNTTRSIKSNTLILHDDTNQTYSIHKKRGRPKNKPSDNKTVIYDKRKLLRLNYFPAAAVVPDGCSSSYARAGLYKSRLVTESIEDEYGNIKVVSKMVPIRPKLFLPKPASKSPTVVICHPTAPIVKP